MNSAPTDTSKALLDVDDKSRNTKAIRYAIFIIGVTLAACHIYINTIGTLPELLVSAFHFAGFGIMCLLLNAAHPNLTNSKSALTIDLFLSAILFCLPIYILLFEDALYARGVVFSDYDWIVSSLAVLLSLELVRRTTGWFIPMLIVLALSYVVFWGSLISGPFAFPGLNLETLLYRSFFSSDGMFGSISRISWSFVFMFILFGAFLVRSGAGDFIIELSRALASKIVGGPGFVAVLGSGLMGSVSGSSVANTVSTGVITIPLMQRAGFPARFAAGIEAAASTGGQLMPPVMGAGAFIMASYTQVSYVTIIGVASIPALLYFLSVAFFVRVEAQRSKVKKTAECETSVTNVLRQGWYHILPLGTLVTMLIQGYTPTYAAGFAILAVIVASWLSPTHRMGLVDILAAMSQGARNMSSTAVLLVGIGLIVNVISTTGVGNTFSLMITSWAGGSLLLTLVLIAIASLILGMGLPVTASYIVLATLSAPALYNLIAESQLLNLLVSGQIPEDTKMLFMLVDANIVGQLADGLSQAQAKLLLEQLPAELKDVIFQQVLGPEVITMALVAAHMIIFWLSQDSNVTPPVCLTAFAAATIAKTPPMRTGITAWKLAKGLYLVPLLMAYTPLIGGDFATLAQLTFFAIFGLYAFVATTEGYLEKPLSWFERGLTLLATIAMLWPSQSLPLQCLGLGLFLCVFAKGYRHIKVATA